MLFKIIKSHPDGMCHNGEAYPLQRLFSEVVFSKGWMDTKEMHERIKEWASKCRPGEIFCTNASAIVAVQPGRIAEYNRCPCCNSDWTIYSDLVVNEDDEIEQGATCHECNRRWVDIFIMSEQKLINSGGE